MPKEATMIILDNSESSRNGDYHPSRVGAQFDAVHLIFAAKTQADPESAVGLMTMGGKGPEVLVTLSTDFGKILEGLHRTKIRGESHLATGIQVAGLALKHRQNKQQRQRIIAFCCSPIQEDEKTLVKLAKKMKKNNISIDFVAFGELDGENTKKLEAFSENVKGGEGSHLAIVPPGPHLLSDALAASPIMGNAGSGAGAGAGGGTEGMDGVNAFEFGVDPSMEPELALALRISLEEEKARLERERVEKEAKEGKSNLEGIPEESGSKGAPDVAEGAEQGTGEEAPKADEDATAKDEAHPGDAMDTTE
ncbi:MAG: hypothetical protein M1826_000586 [Phylliscum demangeonii]|nr:MAG: hypothetical protein M1826_000586 [Phylliscum demangeonii]